MTKAPVPGQVKTRLIPALGAEGAAQLHQAMILDTLGLVKASGLPCSVSVAGDMSHPMVGHIERMGLQTEAQVGASLGERLVYALRGPDRAIALGADCLSFSPDWLREASDSAAPVSLGRAEDGGYWVIAVSPQARGVVFEDIPWSTEAVYQQTLTRAAEAGLEVHRLPPCYDIDRPADLVKILADPGCPSHSRAVLAELLPSGDGR